MNMEMNHDDCCCKSEKHKPHHHRRHGHGAKTFRRGRAIEFLNRLNVKQATLKKQLETPELQAASPIIAGELKAIEAIIDEFTDLFEINPDELTNHQCKHTVTNREGNPSSEKAEE